MLVVAQIDAGVGVPQGNLEVGLGLSAAELPVVDAVDQRGYEIAQHGPEHTVGLAQIGLEPLDVIRPEYRRLGRVHLRPVHYHYRRGSATEGVESCVDHVRSQEELLRSVDHRLQIPCNQVHVTVVQAGGASDELDRIPAGMLRDVILDPVTEPQDLRGTVVTLEGFERVDEEPRHGTVAMQHVHGVVLHREIAVDERGAARCSGVDVQPPVGVGVLDGFRPIGYGAGEVTLCVDLEIESHLHEPGRELRKRDRIIAGLIRDDSDSVESRHRRDLPQDTLHDAGDGPPYHALIILHETRELRTVEGEGDEVPLRLDADRYVGCDQSARIGTQLEIWVAPISGTQVPPLADVRRGPPQELAYLEEPDTVGLWAQEQFVPLAVGADLEGDPVDRLRQDPADGVDDLLRYRAPIRMLKQPLDLRHRFREPLPGESGALTEAVPEHRQCEHPLAAFQELPVIPIIRIQ